MAVALGTDTRDFVAVRVALGLAEDVALAVVAGVPLEDRDAVPVCDSGAVGAAVPVALELGVPVSVALELGVPVSVCDVLGVPV